MWDPRNLPIKSAWHTDGPVLPVEFARQSKDGRITLVVTDGVNPVTVLWAELTSESVTDAHEALRLREETVKRFVGLWTSGSIPDSQTAVIVSEWALSKQIDAVVWTALGPKFSGANVMPTCDQVVAHLKATQGDVRRVAEEYVRKAPAQITTSYRQAIEAQLGWVPSS